MAKRLKGDGEAVELEVDEVALGVAGLAAGGDVGAAGLLDGDGDCWRERLLVDWFGFGGREDGRGAGGTYGWGCSSSWHR